MKNKLFNRLVIAIVVIALVVIFVPMLFSEHTKPLHSGIKRIPAMPNFPEVSHQTVSTDSQPTTTTQQINDSALPKPLSQSDQRAAEKSPNATSSASLAAINSPNVVHDAMDDAHARLALAQKESQAWLVHLTGFANEAAASNAVKQLQSAGLSAYTYQDDNPRNASVNIGPFTQKIEAIKDLNLIKTKFKFNGEVIEFNPTELK